MTNKENNSSGTSLLKISSSLTLPTLISRMTGFIKSLLIVAILGANIASSFNVANQFPNFISELLLGAVLTAVIVPTLIRASEEDTDKGTGFLNKIYTLVLTVLGTATVLAMLASPLLSKIFLGDGKVSLKLTTIFAVLLLPQVLFYGLSALFSATLNVHNSFLPAAWAPVVNNIIGLTTLVIYCLIPGDIAVNDPSFSDPKILILGIGTTLGIVVQALMLLPYLHQHGITLHLKWGIDERLKQFSSMALATIFYVLISLAGLAASLRICSQVSAAGPAIYNNSWSILQLPYGVLGVAILTASMPALSRFIIKKQFTELLDQLSSTIRITFIALIPCAILLMFYGHEIGYLLFDHGKFVGYGETTGYTIAASAFTLIPYALLLINLRVLYAQHQAWHTVLIIIGITIVKIIFSYAVLLFTDNAKFVVIWQGVANGLGFLAGAWLSYLLICRAIPDFHTIRLNSTFFYCLGAGLLIAGSIKYLLDWLYPPDFTNFTRILIYSIIGGGISLLAIVLVYLWLPFSETKHFRKLISTKFAKVKT